MKAKVTIENGTTRIDLKPENDFEKDVIEKFVNLQKNYDLNTIVSTDYIYSSHSKHNIEITIQEKPKSK